MGPKKNGTFTIELKYKKIGPQKIGPQKEWDLKNRMGP